MSTTLQSEMSKLQPPINLSDYFNLSIILFCIGFFMTCLFFM